MCNEREFNIEDFDEYIRQGEPDKKENLYLVDCHWAAEGDVCVQVGERPLWRSSGR
ncbi:MAG: hypothetical protein J6N73_05830 [Prevotella sp.]|nr:hypothetical protein [Prevotella sp.]